MSRSSQLFIAGILALTLVSLTQTGLTRAQTGDLARPGVTANTMHPAYDVAKEVKIQGTIQKIDTSGTDGLPGTHILVQTTEGVVDAHLGFGAASKPQHLGIAPGESVSVIGMMQTLGTSNVLLARVLTTSNRIFVLRNEHGIPVRATPRGSTHAHALQKGL